VAEKFKAMVARFRGISLLELDLDVAFLTNLEGYKNPHSDWKLEVSGTSILSPIVYYFSLSEKDGTGKTFTCSFYFNINKKGGIESFSPNVNVEIREGNWIHPEVIPHSYRIVVGGAENVFVKSDFTFNLGRQYDIYQDMLTLRRRAREEGLPPQVLDSLLRSPRTELEKLQRELDEFKVHLKECVVIEELGPEDRSRMVGGVVIHPASDFRFRSSLEIVALMERCQVALEQMVFKEEISDPDGLGIFKDHILAMQRPKLLAAYVTHYWQSFERSQPIEILRAI
jgi:hypothetical protein